MVFALETYWPAQRRLVAARIKEELIVTADGCELITKFPARSCWLQAASTGPQAEH